MRVVLHTYEQSIAEGLRIALLAEGIDATVHGASLQVGAGVPFTVSVRRDEEYERAVGIREAMERDAARTAHSNTLRPRVVIAVVIIVLTAMWWFMHIARR